MDLFTRSKNVYWDRILDIFVGNTNNLISYINDITTCKLVVLKSGSISIKYNDQSLLAIAPSIICIPNIQNITIQDTKSFEAITVFFKPTVIHDYFTYDYLDCIDVDTVSGTTTYQDYILIEKFFRATCDVFTNFKITTNALLSIVNTLNKLKNALNDQYDGFWPCRSRSYFLELLFFINYSCLDLNIGDIPSETTLGQIVDYLNEHICEKVVLEDITKEFIMNRNKLNDLFLSKTGMTCLNYLLHMRIDLAKLMLSNTELPISEIGARVSFLDTNYFTKSFKKITNITPSQYRKETSH